MHYFSKLFWYRTLHVSDRITVHHQESSTVYTTIDICHTGYADCLLTDSQHNSFTPKRKASGIERIGGLVGLRTGPNAIRKIFL
jgi:hypothetical protein